MISDILWFRCLWFIVLLLWVCLCLLYVGFVGIDFGALNFVFGLLASVVLRFDASGVWVFAFVCWYFGCLCSCVDCLALRVLQVGGLTLLVWVGFDGLWV